MNPAAAHTPKQKKASGSCLRKEPKYRFFRAPRWWRNQNVVFFSFFFVSSPRSRWSRIWKAMRDHARDGGHALEPNMESGACPRP